MTLPFSLHFSHWCCRLIIGTLIGHLVNKFVWCYSLLFGMLISNIVSKFACAPITSVICLSCRNASWEDVMISVHMYVHFVSQSVIHQNMNWHGYIYMTMSYFFICIFSLPISITYDLPYM